MNGPLHHANWLSSAALVAFAMLLAGCSGSKSADQTASQTTSTLAAGGSPAATDASPAADASAPSDGASDDALQGHNDYDPCTKLSVADVQPFYSAPIEMKKETDLVGTGAGCFFNTKAADAKGEGSQLQVVTIAGDQAVTSYDGALKDAATVPLDGIGDKAAREAKDVWVYALKGDVFCMLHSDSNGRGSMRGLEQYAGKDVPDAVAAPFAAKLGTLCTKLFGS